MKTKTRPRRHIYHDIEIPRPKSHDIEKRRQLTHDIVIPRHFFRGQKATTSRFQGRKTTTSRFQDQKVTTSSFCGILTLMPPDILKTSWRRLENALKTSGRRLEDVWPRHLQDEDKVNIFVLMKTSSSSQDECLLGLRCIPSCY